MLYNHLSRETPQGPLIDSRHSLAKAAALIAVIGTIAMSSMSVSQAIAGTGGNWGPHVAYTKAADAEDGNYLVGGHLELMLAPFLGVQGAVDYRSSEPFGNSTLLHDAVQVRSIPVTASARIYLPTPSGFAPFLVGGAGWYHVKYDYSERAETLFGWKDDTVTTFGWHLGAGAKVPVSQDFSIGGEARYTFVDPERDLDSDVRNEIRDLDYDSFYLVGGLNIEF